MAIRVLRRPFATRSTVAASARLRKDGAEVITPNEASAMPPDLMKYLRFMIVTSKHFCSWSLVFGLWSLIRSPKTKDQNPFIVAEIPAIPKSSRQPSLPGCRWWPHSRSQAAVVDHLRPLREQECLFETRFRTGLPEPQPTQFAQAALKAT